MTVRLPLPSPVLCPCPSKPAASPNAAAYAVSRFHASNVGQALRVPGVLTPPPGGLSHTGWPLE